MAGLTPQQVQVYLHEALVDAVAEFARCAGTELDEELRNAFKKWFDKTIGNAIENSGIAWEEPIRSYALRNVCKIAKRADRCSKCGDISPEDLAEAAECVIEKARETCKVMVQKNFIAAQEVGVLCLGG